jgi:hypothetical protein
MNNNFQRTENNEMKAFPFQFALLVVVIIFSLVVVVLKAFEAF